MITGVSLSNAEWEYIASGSANSVFSYIGEDEMFKGKVIRLRLTNSDICTKDILNYFQSPLFDTLRKYMVDSVMVFLLKDDFEKFQEQFNKKYPYIKLDLKEKCGLLMNNIYSHRIGEYDCIKLSKYHKIFVHNFYDDILFELKPKWLYQMPRTHMNCRNCLNALQKKQRFICCNLKLLDKKNGVDAWCEEIQDELMIQGYKQLKIYDSLKKCIFSNYDLIESLYKLQNKIQIRDKLASLSSIEDVDEDLQFNMTIRDVSIFFKLHSGEAFILDLDKKSAKKWKNWKSQEEKLEKLYTHELDLNCRLEASN